MHILVVAESGTWFEPHIVASLRDCGHQVETFFYGPSAGEFYGRARAAEFSWERTARATLDAYREVGP